MVKVDKKEKIMAVAEKYFAKKRFHEIVLDDIAREARVSKGTIYTYFKDKDDLFFQIATSGFDELCELVKSQKIENMPYVHQLSRICESIVAFYTRRRQLFRMMQTEDARMSFCRGNAHKQWQKKRHQLIKAVSAVLRKGQLNADLRTDLSDETLAHFLLGLLRARAKYIQENKESITVDSVVDLFLYGARKI